MSQHQLTSFLSKKEIFYNDETLKDLIDRTIHTLGTANTISRETKRYWLLEYLQTCCQEESLKAVVIRNDPGANGKGLVEVDEIFHVLRVQGLKPKHTVGSEVTLKIIAVHPRTDYLKIKIL